MVYLLHFDPPFKHARHYIGSASDAAHLSAILLEPAEATRSPLLAAAAAAGVAFQLGGLWNTAGVEVWRLRNQNNTPRLCSVCRPLAARDREARVRTVRLGGGGRDVIQ